MADGSISIEALLSTDKFDRQINNLEKNLKKNEDKKLIIETKLQGQEQQLDEARRKTDELADAYQRLKSVQEQVASGKATPQQFTTMQELQNTYGTLEQIGGSFDKALSKQDAMEQKVMQTKLQFDGLNTQATEYKTKIEGIKLQKHQSEVNKLKDGFKGVGSSIQNAVGKAAKLALGIFAIRSAYMALRRASSDLANYDKQYAANIEYIRYALTQMIAPVLRYIVGLASTLLSYINAIAQGWFGINLFSNASAKSFKKMKTSAGGVSKAVKEIKKQLAGFDEMNVLSEDKSSSSGGGGGGYTAPSFDLSAPQGEIPEWLQWIIDNRDLIFAVLAGIVAGIIAIKLGLSGLQALGIGLMIAGIVYTIESLIAYLNDPSWKNFGKVIQGIGVAIVGLGIIIGVATGGWVVAIVGAVILIVGTIIKYWEQIKAFLQSGIDWLTEKSDWIHEHCGDFLGSIYDLFTTTLQSVLDVFDSVFSGIKKIFDGIIDLVTGVFTGNWKKAWEGVKKIFSGIFGALEGIVKGVLNVIIGFFNVFIGGINTLLAPTRTLIQGVASLAGKSVSVNFLRIPSIPRLKAGGIINMPNRGTMVGSAIAGESGREGVIPLTDSQAMETLGEAIGRYITINANITNTMNGRILSRQLQQIKAEQDFAYNH